MQILVDQRKKRTEPKEDFTVADARNPQAWAESDTMLPDAVCVPSDKVEENLANSQGETVVWRIGLRHGAALGAQPGEIGSLRCKKAAHDWAST